MVLESSPFSSTTCPRYFSLGLKNWHFLGLVWDWLSVLSGRHSWRRPRAPPGSGCIPLYRLGRQRRWKPCQMRWLGPGGVEMRGQRRAVKKAWLWTRRAPSRVRWRRWVACYNWWGVHANTRFLNRLLIDICLPAVYSGSESVKLFIHRLQVVPAVQVFFMVGAVLWFVLEKLRVDFHEADHAFPESRQWSFVVVMVTPQLFLKLVLSELVYPWYCHSIGWKAN